ncbi:IS66-like element accessory protein TnpA [Caenimonas koreensis]|uniref:IS66-like element accessory protein TnpA n=1 Tax=Caenimonas koreensis TaxID=367474 RepID=UPI003784FE14
MHRKHSNRRTHSAEFKARILAECRKPSASVSAVAIAHGLNTNVVRKWLAGYGLKRMGDAAPVPALRPSRSAPALQFVPVELQRSQPVNSALAPQGDIRIELQRDGLHVKLQCTANAAAHYATQLRALADALCAA